MQSRYDTIVIGAGQAGLSVGYFLAKQGRDFIILDGRQRIGDAWRTRWDSLRLFTPARNDGLPGMPFPARGSTFPTKDEMADYLEAYAAHFRLPVCTGVRVDSVSKQDGRFVVRAGDLHFEAGSVVVAMGNYQQPNVPAFAAELDPSITQMHSLDYRSPSQLRQGAVLVVGAGNSGAEIALDVVRTHHTFLAGRHVGHMPFRIESFLGRHILTRVVLRLIFHRVMTIDTRPGRRMRQRMLARRHGLPLVRTKPHDLAAAGVERVPRVTGVRDGQPVLEDGRVLDTANVIWCTGFRPNFSWIKLPVSEDGHLRHERGVVRDEPGLYFLGQDFLYAISSAMIHGVERDARYIANHIDRSARPALAISQVGTKQPAEREARAAITR